MKHSWIKTVRDMKSIILQYDSYNFATASQTGTGHISNITQNGLYNYASVTQTTNLTSGAAGLELPAASPSFGSQMYLRAIHLAG